MARLFTSGFGEAFIAQAGSIWSYMQTGCTYDTTHVRSGIYSGKVVSTGGFQYFHKGSLFYSPRTTGTFYTRVYVYFETLPNITNTVGNFIRISNAGNVVGGLVRCTNDGTIYLLNCNDSSQIASTPGVIKTGTWHCIEIRNVVSTVGAGEWELCVDGNSIGTLTGKTTIITGFAGVSFGLNGTSSNGTIWLADAAVNDDTGTTDNTWCGEGHVVTVNPAADVDVQWTKMGVTPATANWKSVNDVPGQPTNDVYTSDGGVPGLIDRFGISILPDSMPSNAVLTLVHLFARVGTDATSNSRKANLLIWDETNPATSSPTVVGGNVNYPGASQWKWTVAQATTSEYVPYSVRGKTKADIQAFNIGYKSGTDPYTRYVDCIYMLVEYTLPTGYTAVTSHVAPTLTAKIVYCSNQYDGTTGVLSTATDTKPSVFDKDIDDTLWFYEGNT